MRRPATDGRACTSVMRAPAGSAASATSPKMPRFSMDLFVNVRAVSGASNAVTTFSGSLSDVKSASSWRPGARSAERSTSPPGKNASPALRPST